MNVESIDRERFGTFLALLRKEKGYTQQELAERLFVSNKAVSKWERAQSLPDIDLLGPLAELLGVTVTELLRGERLTGETLTAGEAEELVGKAIRLSAQEQEKRGKERRFWKKAWVVCATLAALEITALITRSRLTAAELWSYLLLVEGLTLGFGAYFCFFIKETLPAYYDENRVCVYADGFFKMNLGFIRLNNSNWPHIVHAGRKWLPSTAAVWPLVFTLARDRLPDRAMLFLTLLFCLGFFIPMIYAAKKYA